MFGRRIFHEEWADDGDAFVRALSLSHEKEQKLASGGWPLCQRRILFIELIDYPLSELGSFFETDISTDNGFSEIWLADFTIVEAHGRVRLFALVHSEGANLRLPEIELGKPNG
jgi:hypothetical protein